MAPLRFPRWSAPIAGLALALSLAPPQALAQSGLIEALWTEFSTHCAKVIATKTVDQAEYASLPAEHRISMSADGRRVQVDHQTQDLQWSVSVTQSDVGGRRFLNCHVGYHNIQPIDDVEGLAAELLARIEASGPTDINGYPEEQIAITPLWASPGSGIDRSINIDVVGLLPDPDFLMQFQVYSYGVGVGVLGFFQTSEVE